MGKTLSEVKMTNCDETETIEPVRISQICVTEAGFVTPIRQLANYTSQDRIKKTRSRRKAMPGRFELKPTLAKIWHAPDHFRIMDRCRLHRRGIIIGRCW
jgi:hypothetical protein